MRRKARLVGFGSVVIVLGSLCGCFWKQIFPPSSPTLLNSVAVDRALQLCSLSESGQPFHLVLEISPPTVSPSSARVSDIRAQSMQARVEIFWLNSITYRISIHSRTFNQTRIVNGNVVEEHDDGDFYPRWIQNFVDAILDPVPKSSILRKIPGSVPIGVQSHACISTSADGTTGSDADETQIAQVCFQDAEPRIASGVDFTRSVWFDNFAPFGSQKIARTLVNDLPANLLVRGRIVLLEPLPGSDYPLLKASEFTPPAKQIKTTLVSRSTAQSMLDSISAPDSIPPALNPVSAAGQPANQASNQAGEQMIVYIRTDRTGRVREAYRDNSDHFGLQDAAVAHALTLRFKPLVVNGVPRQMEAPFAMTSGTLTGQLAQR